MKKNFLLKGMLGIALLAGGNAFAQQYDWGSPGFGGSYNDVPRDIAVIDNSLGYKITVGSYQNTSSSGTYNGFVRALDSGDNLKWWIDVQGSGNDEVNGVDVRARTSGGLSYGDIYITGYFTGSMTMVLHSGFPLHDIQTTIHTHSANSGVSSDATYFVTKLDQDGGHIWTYVAGTTIAANYNTEIGNDVDVSLVGNEVQVYTTGFFRGQQNFYSTASPIAVSASGTWNAAFTAKYVDNGSSASCSWVQTVNDNSDAQHDYGYGVTGDGSGNIFMTGSIGGNTTVGSNAMTVSGNDDALVVKYNSSGSPQWSLNFGGNGTLTTPSDQGRGISYASGKVYVSGYYNGSGTFTSWSSTVDAFAVQLVDNGTSSGWGWKDKIISATGSDVSYRNTLSKDGSLLYVVGSMTGDVTIKDNWDVSIGTITSFSSGAYANGFMAVLYTSGGSYFDGEWLADDNNTSVTTGVAWLNNQKIYSCGAFKSYFLYDQSGTIVLSNVSFGTNDPFIVRYDSGLSPRLAAPGSQQPAEMQLSAYPNPAATAVTLVRSTDTPAQVRITDLSGREVLPSFAMNELQARIDISSLPPGAYFFTVITEQERQTTRVVKQ